MEFSTLFPSILKPSLSVYHVRRSESRITRPVLTGQAEPLLYFHNKHVTQCNLRVKYFFLIEAARLRGWREVKYSLFFVESWYYWQYLVYIRINEHQRCISLSRQSEEYSPQTSDKHYVNWDKHHVKREEKSLTVHGSSIIWYYFDLSCEADVRPECINKPLPVSFNIFIYIHVSFRTGRWLMITKRSNIN